MATGGCYDILLVGSIGMGKSTTGNKLLKFNPPENQFTPEEVAAIPFFVSKGGPTSTTHYCKLFPKEPSEVRVMDTPGFSGSHGRELSNYDGNLYTFRKILLSQRENRIAFSRVLYFLPQRGPLHRADGKLQEEIKVMYDFFNKAIFNVMIIIATNSEDSRRQIEFSEEDMTFTERAFVTAFESITGDNLPKCPPILYLPVDETDLLSRVKDAPVLHDTALHLETKDEKCIKCSAMLTYTCVRNEKVLIGAETKTTPKKVPVDESKCHPYFIPKYSKAAKTIGGVAYILTLGIPLLFCKLHKSCCPGCNCNVQGLGDMCCPGCACEEILMCWPGFTNNEEVCVYCKQVPNTEGCSTFRDTFERQTTERIERFEICHIIPELLPRRY